jgi:4-hydroxy-3-polyprenylbenzoate decarboxylase
MKLRDYLEILQNAGRLHIIDEEVDWNLELCAIDALNGRMDGPNLLFTNIKGYPKGWSVLTSTMRGTREHFRGATSLILGLDFKASREEQLSELERRMDSPIPPTLVSTGPCKENIRMGGDVNLFEFPWPYIHRGDGGRFCTLNSYITRDLDSDWTNWGNYRGQIQTKNKIGCQIISGSHIGYMYYLQYEAADKPMPCCVAMGGPIEALFVSTLKVPFGVSEAGFVGALAQEPLEMVKAETSDLLVPADAEIVLEGEFRPYERMDEGPFLEFFGYVHGPRVPRPVMRVHCITFRNNPILPTQVEGLPFVGSCWTTSTVASYMTVEGRRMGVDFDAWPTANGNILVSQMVEKIPTSIVENMCLSHGQFQWYDKFFMVDRDVEHFDLDALVESIFLRTHPENFRSTGPDLPKTTTTTYLTPEDRKKGLAAKMTVDATWPLHWDENRIPKKVTLENSYPKEVRQWVSANWQRLGFEGEPKT